MNLRRFLLPQIWAKRVSRESVSKAASIAIFLPWIVYFLGFMDSATNNLYFQIPPGDSVARLLVASNTNSFVNLRQNHQSQILVLKRGRFEPECLGNSSSISKPSTGAFAKLTSSKPPASCLARVRMVKWWSLHSVAAYPSPLSRVPNASARQEAAAGQTP